MSSDESRSMSSLEILDRLLLGQTTDHRREDAWDLLDEEGLVTAVLCPRPKRGFVAISPVARRVPPVRGRSGFVPYKETVKWRISADNLDEGVEIVRRLVLGQQPSGTAAD